VINAAADRREAALIAAHTTAHELLAELAAAIDGVDPDTANWGDIGDLNYINGLLLRALGREAS
jgi:hypothetical protein